MSLHPIADSCKGYEVARPGHYSCTQVTLYAQPSALPQSRSDSET